jgi:hypothetical protein
MVQLEKIYCCECEKIVNAKLTLGKEIYPHRNDLWNLHFWICDICKNYVGTHNKTNNKTKPLGVIPNKEIRQLRQQIHQILDPLWKNKNIKRNILYKKISEKIGKKYHSAEIKSKNEAIKIINILKQISDEQI